jgi:hypothetical protein
MCLGFPGPKPEVKKITGTTTARGAIGKNGAPQNYKT